MYVANALKTNQSILNYTFLAVLSELAMQHHPHCDQSLLTKGQDHVSNVAIKIVVAPQALQLDV